MFWYILLFILAVIFGLMALSAFVLFLLSGCEVSEILLITFALVIIAVALGYGATTIEKENTTINTDIVEIEITKIDITSVSLSNGNTQQKCYITVGDRYLVSVLPEEYANLNIGDIVTVEITNITKFGEAQKPIVTLKG